MKAVRVTVDFCEWGKVNGFLSCIQDEDVLAYQIGNVSFIVVTEGECSMAHVKARLSMEFEEEVIITIIR